MKTNNTEKTKILQSNSNFLIQLAFFVFEEHFVHVSLLKTELLVSTWGVPFAHFPLLSRDKVKEKMKCAWAIRTLFALTRLRLFRFLCCERANAESFDMTHDVVILHDAGLKMQSCF